VLSGARRPRVHDTWIAATVLVNDGEVWTQDTDSSDFAEAVAVVRL
jgi:predicted nucleic acid-binding protein